MNEIRARLIEFFTLALASLFLLRLVTPFLFTSLSSSYGLQGTDIEGATWYRWLNVKNSWNEEQGFWGLDFKWNLGIYTFENFYDSAIIQLSKFFELQYSVIFFSNVLLLATIALNMLATFYFAKIFTQNSFLAFAAATFFVLNTQNILTMRVPINNNLYFLGVIALTIYIRCSQKSLHSAWKISVFLLYFLQININIYNFMPIFLLHMIYMTFKFDFGRPLRSSLGIIMWPILMLIAVFFNFRDSLTLVSRNSTSETLRPVEWTNEIVDTSRIWTINQSGNHFTFLVVILLLLGVNYLAKKRKVIDKDRLLLIYAALVTLLILMLIVFDIGRHLGVQWMYQQVFWQFRGVNYYWKFNTFLLIPLFVTYLGNLKTKAFNLSSIKSLFAPDFPNRRKNSRKPSVSVLPLGVLLSTLLILNLYLSFPSKELFAQRGDISQFEKGLEVLTSRNDRGLTLEIPNRLRGIDKGFPEGYMQLSQIVHQHPLLNGIPDFPQAPASFSSKQNIKNVGSIEELNDRGVVYLIIRPKILNGEEKLKWLELSESQPEFLKLLGRHFKQKSEPDYMELEIYEIISK